MFTILFDNVFLIVLMFDMILCQDFDFWITDKDTDPDVTIKAIYHETINTDISGDLSIVSTSNTNFDVVHPTVTYEMLNLSNNIDGILHYTIGARSQSK